MVKTAVYMIKDRFMSELVGKVNYLTNSILNHAIDGKELPSGLTKGITAYSPLNEGGDSIFLFQNEKLVELSPSIKGMEDFIWEYPNQYESSINFLHNELNQFKKNCDFINHSFARGDYTVFKLTDESFERGLGEYFEMKICEHVYNDQPTDSMTMIRGLKIFKSMPYFHKTMFLEHEGDLVELSRESKETLNLNSFPNYLNLLEERLEKMHEYSFEARKQKRLQYEAK